MCELIKICKSFGQQTVLKDFSLKIPTGARIALMGRSGAGKTTVLRLIMGLEKPDSGSVKVQKRASFGAVFQEDRLILPLSAISNCLIASGSASRDGAVRLLSRLGLEEDIISKKCSELSGGEKRRVAIARAILSSPDIFVLDEPFKGIDAATMPKIYDAVNAASSGKTLILVTHSEDEAKALGCKTVQLDKK